MKEKDVSKNKKVELPEMKETMKDLINICERLQLKYWLEAGNLLGALREHKFIEHDNDIDIGIQYNQHQNNIPKRILKELRRKGYNTKMFRYNRFIQAKKQEGPHIDIHLYKLPSNIKIISWMFAKLHPIIREAIIKYAQMTYFQNEKLRPFKAEKRDYLKRCRIVQLMLPIFFCYKLRKVPLYDMSVNVPEFAEDYLTLNYGEDWIIPKTKFVTYIGVII